MEKVDPSDVTLPTQDGRPLRLHTKRMSVSADVNFGIWFSEGAETKRFLKSLVEEVERKTCEVEVLSGSMTLKLMVKRPEPPDPDQEVHKAQIMIM